MRLWSTILVAVAASLGGCAGLETPTIDVVNVRVTEQSAEAARIEAMVELTNPNDTPLPLTSASYTLSVGNAGSISLDDIPNRTLPALGKQTVLLPASVRTGGANLKGAAFTISGSITYQPPGEMRKILTETGIPLPTADFSKSGRVE